MNCPSPKLGRKPNVTVTALDEQVFDLVLMDMHMPIMDGFTTLEHLKANK